MSTARVYPKDIFLIYIIFSIRKMYPETKAFANLSLISSSTHFCNTFEYLFTRIFVTHRFGYLSVLYNICVYFCSQFVIPGFVDTHIHAPQYPNCGKGLDLGLLEWLEKYTFPTEAKFKDPKFAEHVYDRAVVSKKWRT